MGVPTVLSAATAHTEGQLKTAVRQERSSAAHGATVSRKSHIPHIPPPCLFTPSTPPRPTVSFRDGNFLGHYRGTYHLPLRITRSFATSYNSCLSGRHKYVDYPRDLCCCQYEQQRGQCDWRLTLGRKDDPLWQKPECQTKCEGLKQLLAINDLHLRCKRAKCELKVSVSQGCTASTLQLQLQLQLHAARGTRHPALCTSLPIQGKEKLIPRPPDTSMRNRKRNRKRPVTAFKYNRNRQSEHHSKIRKSSKNVNSTDMPMTHTTPTGPAAAAEALPPNQCAIPICCPNMDQRQRQISPCCLPQDYSVCPPVTCPPTR